MASEWKIRALAKPKINRPVLIEGMPGIGSVGKIAADMIVEQLKPKKMMTLHSHCLPNSVFVRSDDLIEMPKIEIYHKKLGKQDFLFLVGDVQPGEEEDSYAFTECVLDIAQRFKCKEILALGGIGLPEEPATARVFCTGNDKELIRQYTKLGASSKLYGFVGPIMGITGLLLGLSIERKIPAVALLTETYASPSHLGFGEAKATLKIIEKRFKLGLDLRKVDKEVKKFEAELKPVAKQLELQDDKEGHQDTSYIG